MNAVYSTRIPQVVRAAELLKTFLPKGADISVVSHCQDFENNSPVRQPYTEVVFESETPPLHLVHTLIEADELHDDDELVAQGYERMASGLWFYPNNAETQQ